MKVEIKTKEPLVLHFDDLVIGGTLEAFLFSYTFSLPLIYNLPTIPLPFEKHPEIGSKKDMWNNLHMLLSLAGKLPFANAYIELTYIDQETLKVVTNNNTKFYIKFKKLWVFDDLCFLDFPTLDTVMTDVEVIDHFRVLNNWNPEILDVYRDTPVINFIHFFKKDPHDKKQKHKHLYVISKINFDQYETIPEYFIKIRCEALLGCDKLEHLRRTTRSKMANHKDFDNVIFCTATFEEMYPFAHKRQKITYQEYLRKKLKLGT